ncbi:glucose 1-dehydrogenase [Propionicicella superfundia]|uniref:glucose 1-dehydrogenase n=1 Tax=Propionicicella superfundia TaxID=348582 RepID=UPI00041FB755
MSYADRFTVSGKKAIVTGGSRGIGQACAVVLAEAGAEVAIVGRDTAALAESEALVKAAGNPVHVVTGDVLTASGARQAARDALAALGGVADIVVNCAGIARIAPLTELSQEDWDDTIAVNLTAPFAFTQEVVGPMIAQKSGKVVNISSQAGVIALDGHGAYCASKGGINMLTKMMALEWGPSNIQVNAVAPTVILTPMGTKVWGDPAKADPMLAKIPLGRFGQPVEVADLVLFLSSSASDLITGDVILIDGGYTAI